MLQHHSEMGGCKPESTYWGVWLFDKVECNKPVWYYYVASAALKFPLLVWLMIFIFVGSFFKRKSIVGPLKEHTFIWVPFVYFLLILSLTNKFQIGIRHAMLVMPFMYMALSGILNRFYEKKRTIFISLCLLNIISLATYWPNLIAYTNELVLNKTKVYKLLRDSSIDYGQSRPWVKGFLRNNPSYKIPTHKPDTGRFAITIGDLYAEHEGPLKNIAWLRENFAPNGNYCHTILLFEVTQADLQSKGLVLP